LPSDHQIKLLKIEEEVNREFSHLIMVIQNAENLLSKPNASVEELQKSREILETSRPKLQTISNLYEDLDVDDAESAELKKKSADQLAKLNQLFTNNQQVAQQRIDAIAGQKHQELVSLIEEARAAMLNPKTAPAEFDSYSTRLLDSVNLTQNLPHSLEDSETSQNLNRLIEMANQLKRNADEKADLWKRFRELRDKISDEQDNILQVYNSLATHEPKPVDQAGSILEQTQVS
jgi:hypothetical protein